MAPKLFITGGTGYIGGSVLHTIATAHPEYDITVLLRRVPEAFTSTYPNLKIVKGDYDSTDLLSEEASKADVVVHNGDSDHEPSLNALITGLLRRSTPGFLLHLSGTGIVSDWQSEEYLGKLNPKIWSDLDSTSLVEIRSLPDTAFHRNTEKILHTTAAEHGDKINIAVMCPPDIYGRGKGLVKTTSALMPLLVKEAKDLGGRVFFYGEGTNTRSWVSIDDLMVVYLKVVEAAVAGGGGFGWNKDGYYFAGTQEHSQLDLAIEAGKILHKHGVVSDPEPIQVSLEKLDTMTTHPAFPKLARYLFASNSRTRAERAKKLFGYEGKAPGLLDVLESDILDVIKT